MNHGNNTNVFDEIQSLCREFRHCLKRDEPKEIEEYLGRVDESARETFFQNLLIIDVEFRRRKGENHTSDEYIKRFPQFAKLIRQAFFESTLMSQELDRDTPDSAEPTVTLGMPAARKLGEYELLRELGRGGFGVVYEARHLKRGDRVALKTLPMLSDGQLESSRDAERLHKFRREFRSLSQINHPNLVGMQTLEVDGNQWFFTMDLVNGVDFLDYVRPGRRLDEERLRTSLKELVCGIVALHEQGIVHRDLKPSNVLVDPRGHVSILDFGLVAELQEATGQTLSAQTQNFAGTPRYAAPEQAFGKRTPATDWYALGVMIYEALTDEAPFKGSGVELLVRKQNEPAQKLSDRNDVPSDLADLTDALLEINPESRPDTNTIAACFGIRDDSRLHDSHDSASMTPSLPSDRILIGREHQLAELDRAWTRVLEKREPFLAFVRGRSGEGKTALVEHFLSSLLRHGDVLVLSGRCYDRESVPFKAIDSLIDPLVAFLRKQSSANLARLLPNDIHMLAELFPVLRRVDAIAQRDRQDIREINRQQIRYRSFTAMRELLISISQSTPVLVFVDDLQWGDADSAVALLEVLSPPGAPTVLMIGSYRRDEASASPFLSQWQQEDPDSEQRLSESTIEVAPLTEDQCRSLMAFRFGQTFDALPEEAERLFQAAHGNPYFLEQLLEGFDPSLGMVEERSLDQIIEARLERLPEGARELLKTVAISGQAARADEVAVIANSDGQALATLTHMRSEKIVRLIGSRDRLTVDTYHDKIRESVLQAMDASERRSRHLQFGEYLERTTPLPTDGANEIRDSDGFHPRVHDIAYHFFEAKDPRAFRYQLDAGKASLNDYAMENAFETLERASRIVPAVLDSPVRFELQFCLAEAHRGVERFEDCRNLYESAIDLAPDDMSLAKCHYGIGSSYTWQGEASLAVRHFNDALAYLNAPMPKTRLGEISGIVVNLSRFHFVPAWFRPLVRSKDVTEERDRLVSSILALYPYIGYTDTIKWLHAFTRLLVIGGLSTDDVAKGIAYGWYGAFFLLNGFVRIGQRYLGKAREFSERSTSQVSKAILGHMLAGEFLAGNLVEAETTLKAAIPEMRRIRHYNLPMSFHWLRHIHSIDGNAEKIVESASQELKCGEHTNDNLSIAYGLYGLADGLSRRGEFARAIECAREASARLSRAGLLTLGIAEQELGRAQLQASEYDAAEQTLNKNIRLIVRKCALTETFLDTFSLHTEAVVGDDWVNGSKRVDHKKQKAVRKSARRARFLCARFPTLRAHCYRVSGRAAFACGRLQKASKYFNKAIASAEKIGARYEAARALIDKSILDHSDAVADRRRGLEMLGELGCVLPLAEQNYLNLIPKDEASVVQ